MSLTQDIRNAYDARDRDELERCLAKVADLENRHRVPVFAPEELLAAIREHGVPGARTAPSGPHTPLESMLANR